MFIKYVFEFLRQIETKLVVKREEKEKEKN